MVKKKENYLLKTEKLGNILIRRKIVSPDKINKALEIQKQEKKFLGEILVRLGYADERDIVVALVIQCHMPYIAVDKYDIDLDVIRLVPSEIARKYLVIPLDRVGNVLSVVMVNPLDLQTRDELQQITHCRIAPFIGLRCEIELAIKQWYG